jgi:hypothetical protein
MDRVHSDGIFVLAALPLLQASGAKTNGPLNERARCQTLVM